MDSRFGFFLTNLGRHRTGAGCFSRRREIVGSPNVLDFLILVSPAFELLNVAGPGEIKRSSKVADLLFDLVELLFGDAVVF